ncbi:MAG: hypothetical protein Q8R15_03285 [Candidatus Micrarchaeota archaeon]|nr:hypothetical protein [Candidatus Micrarchaeota archaeon]
MSEAKKGIVLQIKPIKGASVELSTKLYFYTSAGNEPRNSDKTKLFVPLPEKKFKKLEMHFATHVRGESLLAVTKNSIEWRRFYPFGTQKPLRGTRIGELVHHAIVEHLADNYPNRIILHGSSAITPARRKQLRKMRIKEAEFYEIETYRQLVRRHMERRFGMRF